MSMSLSLDNIGEEMDSSLHELPDFPPPPETPKEPMEFLARSWSISALEVCRALTPLKLQCEEDVEAGELTNSKVEEWRPFTVGSSEQTSQLVMDNILSQSVSKQAKAPEKSWRMKADKKGKKKDKYRSQNADVQAAMSVGGVAAAVAAVAAATARCQDDGGPGQSKTSMAVASAAALVAAQCVEKAVSMGADRHQLASLLASAVNVKTPGDIITLTAGAATALHGAAALRARAAKEVRNNAAVIPYEKGSNNPTAGLHGNLLSADSELCSLDLLARGFELLKRTRNGDLHWKLVFVYIKNGEVVVKLKSRHIGGTLTKKKKRIVLDVCRDLPAWPGRESLAGSGTEERCYFGLETAGGVIQFECMNKIVHRICTEGVAQLLSLAQSERSRLQRIIPLSRQQLPSKFV